MKILTLPGPDKPKRKDRWFADRLQFGPEGRKLIFRMTVLDFWGVGQFEVATGRWEPSYRFPSVFEECPHQPWSQDFSRVVTRIGPGSDDTGTVICVDDVNHLPGKSPEFVMRWVETDTQTESVSGVTFSPDGRWLYGAELWRNGSGQKAVSTVIARADVQALFAKPPNERSGINRLTGQAITYQFVKPTRWTRFATLPAGVVVRVVSLSPGGQMVAAGSTDGDTHLIRVRGGVSLGVLMRSRRKRTTDVWVRRIVFSPSGKQLGVIAGGVLKVWDTKTMKLMWDTEAEKVNAIDLAYHPDGKTLAVVRQDGTALFVAATDGTMRKRYDWKVGQLNSVAYSPDGLTCAAGGEKGQIVVWDVEN